MSGTEAVGVAVTEIVTVLDEAQKRRRIEDATINIMDPEICKIIDAGIGTGTTDDIKRVLREHIRRKATGTGSGNSDDNPDAGVAK